MNVNNLEFLFVYETALSGFNVEAETSKKTNLNVSELKCMILRFKCSWDIFLVHKFALMPVDGGLRGEDLRLLRLHHAHVQDETHRGLQERQIPGTFTVLEMLVGLSLG